MFPNLPEEHVSSEFCTVFEGSAAIGPTASEPQIELISIRELNSVRGHARRFLVRRTTGKKYRLATTFRRHSRQSVQAFPGVACQN